MHKRSLLALVVLGGCATSPISYTGNALTPAADTYSCAMREVNRLGYTVANTDRASGFITAEKQTSGLGTALLTGQKYISQLTVAIFDGQSGATTLRVTAAQASESAMGFGAASKTGIKPSKQGMEDAQALIGACSSGGSATAPAP